MRVILEPDDILEAVKLWVEDKGLDSEEVSLVLVKYGNDILSEQQKTSVEVRFSAKKQGPKNGPYR